MHATTTLPRWSTSVQTMTSTAQAVDLTLSKRWDLFRQIKSNRTNPLCKISKFSFHSNNKDRFLNKNNKHLCNTKLVNHSATPDQWRSLMELDLISPESRSTRTESARNQDLRLTSIMSITFTWIWIKTLSECSKAWWEETCLGLTLENRPHSHRVWAMSLSRIYQRPQLISVDTETVISAWKK